MERGRGRSKIFNPGDRVMTREVTYVMNLFREKGKKLKALHEADENDFANLTTFLDLLKPEGESNGGDLAEGQQRLQRWMSESLAVQKDAAMLQERSFNRAVRRRQRLEEVAGIPAIETGLWTAMPEVRVPVESM